MSPAPSLRAALALLTEAVYWLLVIGALLLLASSPALILWALLPSTGLGMLLMVLAALPLLPAVTAGLHAAQQRGASESLTPARDYLRGYRRTAVDALRHGGPLLLVLGILAVNIGAGEASPLPGLRLFFLAVALVVLAMLVRTLSIAAQFSFRAVDMPRLAVHSLVSRPLGTAALLSLGVLTIGLGALVGEFIIAATCSALLLALHSAERPTMDAIRERFVAAEPGGTPASAAPLSSA